MNHVIFYICWIAGIHVLVECFTGNTFFHATVATFTVAALAFITRQHFEFLEHDKQEEDY